MNMAYNRNDSQDFDGEQYERSGKEKLRARRHISHSSGTRPKVFNGIHRRRNKRFSW